MEIKRIRAKWHEPKGFCLERNDTGDEYIFIQFLSSAEVMLHGEMVHAEAGSCLLYEKHAYQFMHSEEALVHDWMHIKGDLEALLRRYEFQCNQLYKVHNRGVISDMIQELEEAFLIRPLYYEELVRLKMEELVLKILRESTEWENRNRVQADVRGEFIQLRLRLGREYQKQWTVPEMAETVGFSQAQFCKLYKDIFHISPKRDLQMIRMEQAKTLLLRNMYPVHVIAELCGYTNRFHFIRTFKKETGMTPLEYVKKRQS